MKAKRRSQWTIPYGAETIEEKRGRIMLDAEPALIKEFEWFQNWFDREARQSIRSHWELGQRFKRIYDDATMNGGRRYGIYAVEQICDYFGWDDGVIYNTLKLVQNFTQAEIDQICDMRMANGQLLSYSHLRCLLMVPDRAKRQEFIQKAVDGQWTCKRLVFEIAPELAPKKPITDHRGRPLAIPRDFDAVLAQMECFADDFLNRAEKVWETERHSLGAKFVDLLSEHFTKDRAEKIKSVANKLLRLAEGAKHLSEATLAVHQGFLNVLEKLAPKLIGTNER